jgi:predicted benzoate:H+ symporter BenE
VTVAGRICFSLGVAKTAPEIRDSSIITFMLAASGEGFFGVSGAFRGVLASGVFLALV